MSSAGTDLLWSILKNATSQTGGRLLVALMRFGIVILIVQRSGLELFGDYALILSFLMVGEWLTDFGQTDIAVRDVSRERTRQGEVLAAALLAKVLQSILAAALLVAVVALLGYPEAIIRATAIAGLVLLFHGGVLVYRVLFRVNMIMERDVAAELLSTLGLVVAVWVATGHGASLDTLVLCYAASRAAYLAGSMVLARGLPTYQFGPGTVAELRLLLVAALPIGFAGILTTSYDAMDAVAISFWWSSEQVGAYTAAMRFLVLAVLAVQAISIAVFPVLAAQWQSDRAAFKRTAQGTLDSAVVIGGAIFCALHVGADGLAALLASGAEAEAITSVLRVLAWAILARVVVTVMAPLVVVSGKQLHVIWITAIVVVAKALALAWLVPESAAIGAARAYLLSEAAIGLLPTILICQRVTGLSLNWGLTVKSLLLAAALVIGTQVLGLVGSIWAGALAAFAFVALVLLLGVVPVSQLQRLYASIEGRFGGRAGA